MNIKSDAFIIDYRIFLRNVGEKNGSRLQPKEPELVWDLFFS